MIKLNQPQPGLENNSQNQFSNQFQNQAFNQGFANQQGFDQNQQSFNQTQNQPLNNQLSAPQGFFKIPEQYLKLISLAPFALEMLTGQKIPATGAMADILSGVQQLQFNLQQLQASLSQVSTQQQQL